MSRLAEQTTVQAASTLAVKDADWEESEMLKLGKTFVWVATYWFGISVFYLKYQMLKTSVFMALAFYFFLICIIH